MNKMDRTLIKKELIYFYLIMSFFYNIISLIYLHIISYFIYERII